MLHKPQVGGLIMPFSCPDYGVYRRPLPAKRFVGLAVMSLHSGFSRDEDNLAIVKDNLDIIVECFVVRGCNKSVGGGFGRFMYAR
jgi:hypothetical protein